MEVGEGSRVRSPKLTVWTQARVQALLEVVERAEPRNHGYYKRLEYLWNCKSNTPSTGTALGQKLNRLKRAGVGFHSCEKRIPKEELNNYQVLLHLHPEDEANETPLVASPEQIQALKQRI